MRRNQKEAEEYCTQWYKQSRQDFKVYFKEKARVYDKARARPSKLLVMTTFTLPEADVSTDNPTDDTEFSSEKDNQ